ncbi:hypothetical protein KSP40_PGU002070 [Platanthera guangdongensis]|uniref:Uncharacterized protein n=1 Tax=Platanthera guangdongensis TaxID=2320717 RepID=A0ABR2M1H6_9ASPA
MGRAVGFLPYVGYFTIIMTDMLVLKVCIYLIFILAIKSTDKTPIFCRIEEKFERDKNKRGMVKFI